MKKLIIILLLLIGCSESTNPTTNVRQAIEGIWLITYNGDIENTSYITIVANADNLIWYETKFWCKPKLKFYCKSTANGLDFILSFIIMDDSLNGYAIEELYNGFRYESTFTGIKI